MATTFVPLELGLISEGVFLDRVNHALAELQAGMESFRTEHKDSSQGAKAKLTVEVELVVVDSKDGGYGIKASYKTSLPKHPAETSLAVAGESQDGRPSLLVRQTGSDRDSPRQGKLFGRPADSDD
jgi:hypothetical protein